MRMGSVAGGSEEEKPLSARDKLTERQLECLEWVHRGFETKEIARELGLSPQTVDMHIKNAIQRLDASNRRTAARMVHGRSAPHQSSVHHPMGMSSLLHSSNVEASTALADPPRASFLDVVGRPFPTEEAPMNDLSAGQRLFWIVAIAVGVLVGFGALISSLESLGRLLHR